MSYVKRALKWLAPCVLALTAGMGTAHANDEFNGKLAGWLDVTAAPYGANGSDGTDDTTAIQAALNALGGSGKKVLYIPNGTYYINQTLTMSAKSGVTILGQSRDGVTIVWRGAAGGTMMESQGNWMSRFGRITWDGQDGAGNKAGTIWWDWFKGERADGTHAPGAGFAVTHNEHADEVFKDAAYGIRAGGKDVDLSYNQMDAETPVLRCKFLNLTTCGVSVEDPNALDWFIWYGDFQNCGKGVSNNANSASNGGNFHVYYSKFSNSTVSDFSFGHTSYFSIRGNYSIGSAKFLVAEDYGTLSASVLMQNNTVLDCQTQPCIRLQNAGPLTMIDNKFRQLSTQTMAPMVAVGGGWPDPSVRTLNGSGADDTISIGNHFSASNPIVNFGRLRSSGDTVGDTGISGSAPTLPGELPYIPTGTGANQRPIQEITAASGTDVTSTLQAAITSAVSNAGKRPIIHFPDGTFKISSTITIPANLDVQIIGDGFAYATIFQWVGTGVGPVFQLSGPSKASLRDFRLIGGSNGTTYTGADGIWIGATNQSGERISLDQINFSTLLATSLPNTTVEMQNCYNGGAKTAAFIADNSRISLFAGQMASNNQTFDVTNGGKIMAQDFWYETGANASAPATPGFMNLTGSGNITLQNFLTSPVTSSLSPAIKIDGFQGNVNLLGMSGNPGYSSNPFKTVVTNNSTSALSMVVMGSNADTSTWFENNSTSANIGFFNNKGGGSKLAEYRTGSAASDDAMITSALAQIRSEQPTTWPLAAPSTSSGKSDVRLSRVFMEGSPYEVKVAYSNTTGPTPTPTPTATPTPTLTPTAPPGSGTGTGLTGEYYNDGNLAPATLVSTQIDPTVNFAWGTVAPTKPNGSAISGITSDNYSVRWSGQVQAIEAGAYSFQTNTDDGVRLWLTDINGTPLINDWTSHAPTTNTIPSTITLTAGQKINIKMEYFELTAGAEAHLLWKRPGQSTYSAVPQLQLYPTPALPLGTGLTGQYYSDKTLTTLVNTRIDPNVYFYWGSGGPMTSVGPDNFSVRWSGEIQAVESGLYTFTTTTDDGVRLWVNNQLLVDKWVDQATSWSNTIYLTVGQRYPFKMEYYDNTLGAVAQLAWRRPGQSSDLVVPQDNFFPTSSAPAAPTGLTATAGNTQVVLNWTASSGATSYNVYRGTTAGGESATPIATGITATTYTNTGLTNGTPYYYKVRAVNSSGTSADSNEANATPIGVPAAPTGLVALAGNAQVTLNWTGSAGASTYNVYRGTTANGESATPIVTGLTSASYTNTGLTNATTYFYKVRAVNGVGTSTDSNESSAIPNSLPTAIVALRLNENSGTSAANSGSAGGSLALTSTVPAWSSNVPTIGGISAIDFGTTTGDYAVESASAISALGGLSKFTITGWLNCRSSTEGSGGNRVVSWINGGADGVDLVYKADGSLLISIDEWNDWPVNAGVRSSASKITTSSTAVASNWKYFAITYDSTLASNQVSFYFGDNATDATLDVSRTYSGRGAVGTTVGRLALGHFNSATRSGATDRMFRGLMDNLKIYGDALTLSQVVQAQRIQ